MSAFIRIFEKLIINQLLLFFFLLFFFLSFLPLLNNSVLKPQASAQNEKVNAEAHRRPTEPKQGDKSVCRRGLPCRGTQSLITYGEVTCHGVLEPEQGKEDVYTVLEINKNKTGTQIRRWVKETNGQKLKNQKMKNIKEMQNSLIIREMQVKLTIILYLMEWQKLGSCQCQEMTRRWRFKNPPVSLVGRFIVL